MTLENELQSYRARISTLLERKQFKKVFLPLLLILQFIPIILIRFIGGQMYSFFFLFYIWVSIYVTFLFLLVIYNKSGEIKSFFSSNSGLATLILITLASRLVFFGSETIISLDTLWYLDYGEMMLNGQMPYADFYYLYPPIFGYFTLIISIVFPAIDSFRLLATAFDIGIVCVLWVIVKKREYYTHQELLPFAYVLLPISIIESGMNGHFEPIANLTLIIGLWWILREKFTWGSVMLGLSAATKIYAVFLIPIVLLIIPTTRKKIYSLLVAAVTCFLTFIPFSIPVWLRGDLIFPGMPMPGTETGFLDSTFGFLSRINIMQTSSFSFLVIAVSGVLLYIFYRLFSSRGQSNVS